MKHTSIPATIAQCKAEILRTARNKRFVFFSILLPVGFFFLFTSTMDSSMTIGNADWGAYYLMSMTAYGVIGASLTSFAQRIAKERAEGWVKLVRLTPLPSWSYVFSKMAAQGVINLFIIVVMFLIGGIGRSISLPLSVWLLSGLWLWAGGFSFMALGTLLGSLRNQDLTQVLSLIVYMGLSILGGLWMPTATFPDFMKTVAAYTPTFRLGEGAWNLVGGGAISLTGVLILAAYVTVFMVLSSYILKKQEAV
ncbi:ABC transporter permease [Paenibacillus sp. J31TS4]|uniref:ABC transporter permease n=1 Tax=Paenibacillus sp. J31TS4 TaxID=2807195 RepID=UPI001B2F1CAC|nr:ABC transporter permease [Paenibacillus sp. J31TS4]GIP37768.1 ABC transporter permease [Paenibacillus sp. J31TS4]